MANLHDTLWNLTADPLNMRRKFLNSHAKVTRKADIIDSIKSVLEGPGLRGAWDSLDETEKLAVAEAAHDPSNEYDPVQFSAKYGHVAEFHHRPENVSQYSFYPNASNATRLNVFFYDDPYTRTKFIPDDLAARLRTFVPAPEAATILSIPEPFADETTQVRHTESEALSDCGALLRLASLGTLRFGPTTGIPSKVALDTIQPLLAGGDWFPREISENENRQPWQQTIGPIKAVGWTRLLHAAGLISMSGSKSTLTAAGRRAIEKPAWETITVIWNKWISNKLYDEFNRIDLIKGQAGKGALTARVPRRAILIETLAECPVGEWVTFDGFSSYMRATGGFFEVTNAPGRLYIDDRQYGHLGYSGFGTWEVLQDRYLLCIFMEYAATLGLIDIAYRVPTGERPVDNWGMDSYEWLSRYDGLHAFRINPLGAYVLGDGQGDFRPSRIEAQVGLAVGSDLVIRVSSGCLSSAERIQLETWADPITDSAYRANEVRALSAVEAGNDPVAFAKFLGERSEESLPETMAAFLQAAQKNGEAISQSGNAILFECQDASTAAILAKRKELSKICLRAGDTTLVVREEGVATFRKFVRSLGWGIR